MVNSSHWGKALWPGMNSWYEEARADHDTEYTKVFETRNSRKAFEEIMGTSGLGLAAVKPAGQSIIYDTHEQGFLSRFQNIEYGLGVIIERTVVEDDQYEVVGKQRAAGLGRSLMQTKETVLWNVLNRADTAGYTGGDGVTLLNSAHPYKTGGSFSNILSTAADLSEAALEQAYIDIGKYEDSRGLKIAVKPMQLILPVDLEFEAMRITEAVGRPGTADNDIATMSGGRIPKICISHYLTDANMWFLQTDAPDGLIHFERRSPEFEMENDFDTSNAKYKATERYCGGWANPFCVFGSNPA